MCLRVISFLVVKQKIGSFLKPAVVALVCQDGASARRFRPSSSTRESLAMAVAERKAAMAKHKDSQAVCQFSKAYMTSFNLIFMVTSF